MYNQTRVRAGQQGATCTDSYPKLSENPTQYKSKVKSYNDTVWFR